MIEICLAHGAHSGMVSSRLMLKSVYSAALEAQRQMYEEQMSVLKSQLSTGSTSSPVPWNHYLAGSHSSSMVSDRLQRRIQQMAQERCLLLTAQLDSTLLAPLSSTPVLFSQE